jgi:perosamine synthetase
MNINDITVSIKSTLRDALKSLNFSGLEILFVVNGEMKLVGILTDGDIRRALLSGLKLDDDVIHAMNTNFVAMPFDSDNVSILSNLSNSIKVIPLVDENNKLVDYASINKIRRISVASPVLSGNELPYVVDCIKTNWISSQGKYVKQFEEMFKNYHKGREALAVSNGTVALHLALVVLGIGPGDEILVPNFTFAASVNAILYTGAIPVLVDIDKKTWNIDEEKIEAKITPKTKGIMPVHIYGHPCDMSTLIKIADRYNLKIIEDCAEALGSMYKGEPVGCFGDVATFSFFGNKTITTGEGGMVLFKRQEDAAKAALLRDHGMQKDRRYWHQFIGYNYRITNIQAAIGVAQMEQLEKFVAAKRQIAKRYNQVLNKIDFFETPVEKKDCINSYWLYTFLVKPNAPFQRDDLIEFLSLQGIETRPVFFPIHMMPPYINFGKAEELTVSMAVSEHGISLPSSVNLTESEIEHVVSAILRYSKKFIA